MERETLVNMILIGLIGAVIGGAAGTQVGTLTATSAQQTLQNYPLELSLSGQHRHDRLDVPADEAPDISMEVHRDQMMPTHFNLHITTTNFTFAPDSISTEHVMGEGHAHVFVDDTKISRAYGDWYHIPRLSPGEHRITVTLNTNDHREYAIDGTTINATTTVTVPQEDVDAMENMDMRGGMGNMENMSGN